MSQQVSEAVNDETGIEYPGFAANIREVTGKKEQIVMVNIAKNTVPLLLALVCCLAIFTDGIR